MGRHLLGSAATLALLTGVAFAQDATETGAGGMNVALCAPVVTVTQSPPEVRITLSDDPASEPQVSVVQAPPQVEVQQCPPTLTGADGAAIEGVEMAEAEPEIVVNAAETAQLVVTRQGAALPAGADDDAPDLAGAVPMDATDDPAPEDAAPDAALDETVDEAPDEYGDEPVDDSAAADAPAPDDAQADTTDEAPADDDAAAVAPSEAEDGQPPATTLNTQAEEADSPGLEAAQEVAPGEPDAATEAEPAPAPETGAEADPAPATQTDPAPATETPPATDTEADEPGAEADPASATQADPAPTTETGAAPDAETDAAPAAPATTPDGDSPAGQAVLREGNTALDPAEAMQFDLEGVPVISSDDEEIGQIRSVDPAGMAVLGVGGFLGLGERDVLLPQDQLFFQRDAEGELRAYVAFPSDQVEELPDAE